MSSIKGALVATTAEACSRLNALSCLNLLAHRVFSASGIKSNSTPSNESGPVPTLPVDSKLARFVGGAAVTRINVLARLNQFLDQLTSEHKTADKVKASLRDGSDINMKNKSNQ